MNLNSSNQLSLFGHSVDFQNFSNLMNGESSISNNKELGLQYYIGTSPEQKFELRASPGQFLKLEIRTTNNRTPLLLQGVSHCFKGEQVRIWH